MGSQPEEVTQVLTRAPFRLTHLTRVQVTVCMEATTHAAPSRMQQPHRRRASLLQSSRFPPGSVSGVFRGNMRIPKRVTKSSLTGSCRRTSSEQIKPAKQQTYGATEAHRGSINCPPPQQIVSTSLDGGLGVFPRGAPRAQGVSVATGAL